MRLIDFMPPRGEDPDVVRIVEGLAVACEIRSELVIRFDYGSIVPWVRRLDDSRAGGGRPRRALLPRRARRRAGENLTTVSEFEVEPGDRVPFVLTWFPSHTSAAARDRRRAGARRDRVVLARVDRAVHRRGRVARRDIQRSLIVLKSLIYAPTGGIVAAPTTSLPEEIGGVRNWDYRYCWLRDATLTLLAFLGAGYGDEAEAWRDWLLRAVAGDPADLQIMYGVAGERRLPELELDWLPGLRGLAAGAHRERRQQAAAARRLRRGRRRALPGARARPARRPDVVVAAPRRSSATSSGRGASRTTASGRCAGRDATSRTPR